MKKLKLYVWHDALRDYTPGVMFALAESVEQAKELVRDGCKCLDERSRVYKCTKCIDSQKEPTVYETPVGFSVWGGG